MIHDHGGPDHNRALDKAADYFHDAYGGTMVRLLGLQPLAECCGTKTKMLTPAQLKEEGLSVHCGVEETSQMLFLKPGLVRRDYREASSWTAKDFKELYELIVGQIGLAILERHVLPLRRRERRNFMRWRRRYKTSC
jgi:hypothetical protein